MATYKPIWWKYHQDKAGMAPVKIRISSGGSHVYVNLNLRISGKDWDSDKGEVRRSHPNYKGYNNLILQTIATLQDEGLRQDRPMAKDIRDASFKKKNPNDSFYVMAEKILSKITGNTTISYSATLNFIKKAYKPTLTLSEINYKWVHGFVEKLGERGLSDSSIKIKIAFVRMVVKKAEAEGLISLSENPFRGLSFKKSSTIKEVLSLQELDMLRNAHLHGQEAQARDAFLLSFNIRGIRASDTVSLGSSNIKGDRIVLTTHKDNEEISCLLTQEATQIIARNKSGDCFFSFLKNCDLKGINLAVNLYRKALLRAAAKAGITKHVTPHLSRHTWTHFALQAGVDMRRIQDSLGHADIKTTQGYAHSLGSQELDRINTLVTKSN